MASRVIKLGIQSRTAELDRAAVNAEKRTVELSFSSEAPVERYFGVEILDHDRASVDLSRIKAGGALLVDHDTRDQIGVVEDANIGDDKKGRAVVRFGNSARANEIFQDVKDGIRRLVSVGYRINKMVTEKVEKGVETLRATSWTPLEISLVSVPADPSVGIGRADQQEQFEIPIENMKRSLLLNPDPAIAPPAGGSPTPTPGLEMGRSEGATAERNRIREINAIAARLTGRVDGIADRAQQAIDQGVSLDKFRAEAMESLPAAQPVREAKPLDIKPREWERYSLTRAIRGAMDKNLSGFEKEMSDECAIRHGKKPDGFWMPDEYMGYKMRSAIAGTGTLGGMIVQTTNLASEFVEVLRNRSQVLNLGARVLNLTNQVTIPRQNGAATANWVGETVASTLSAINFTQLTLTPQAISANVQYGKMLMIENDPSIDMLLRDDIAQILGIAIDLAALHGTGSGQPTGIAATTGIGTVTLAANALALGNTTAYPAMVSLETTVATANADVGSLAYLMRPGHRGALRTSARFANSDTPVWDPATNRVNGYRAEVTAQIATNLTTGTATTICSAIFFGNWNDLLIGNFGSTDLVVDPYTAGANGVVRLYARRWVDIGIRHPASFAMLGGILTT